MKVTSGYGVTFQTGSGLELVVHAGVVYAPKETKRKYVLGGAVMWGGGGHPMGF